METQDKKPSILGGTMIIAGTTVGAGMLTLSTISAGMWTFWTVLVMVVSVAVMFASACMILEVNLFHERGASFNTLVSKTLGPMWNVVNGITVAFVLYILVYAYISGGGSTLKHTFDLALPQSMISLVYALVCAGIVVWSAKAVDRVSVVLMIGMVITLVASIGGMLPAVNVGYFFQPDTPQTPQTKSYLVFVLATLPYFLTSFCFHGSVPSLVKYFGKDSVSVKKCIVYGLAISFTFYFFWLLTNFGIVNREGLRAVYAAGGNVGDLLNGIQAAVKTPWINHTVSAFAFFAVISSFLGAGLGLFDYIADMFKIDDSFAGRLKTGVIVFVPPIIGSIIWPWGFVTAIGFAGLAAAVWSVIVPAMMAKKSREINTYTATSYKASGGQLVVSVVLIYGVITGICHIFSPDLLGMLPVYK